MITGILFQALQLYKLCQFADKTTILDTILPGIDAKEYFDDRLADTLDAICEYGIGDPELLITRNMITRFDIESKVCHNDTTSLSTYGNCDNSKTDGSINITFGYSKKHRQDLRQLIWSLSVSSESGFPLFQKACSGNTADADTYAEQWKNLIDLSDVKNFLCVADSKLITEDAFGNKIVTKKNETLFFKERNPRWKHHIIFFKKINCSMSVKDSANLTRLIPIGSKNSPQRVSPG
jgi:transposase